MRDAWFSHEKGSILLSHLTIEHGRSATPRMQVFWVDAFTSRPFSGNPACVCPLDSPAVDDQIMQNVAAEMNVSETAFVVPRSDGFSIRWFTPKAEVTLCGHATLASAHILWESSRVPPTIPIVFHSKSGDLRARKVGVTVELDFPQRSVETTQQSEIVNEGLGIAPTFTGKDDKRYLLEIDEPQLLRTLTPNFAMLSGADRGAFMVTCKSDANEYDFLCRFFAPGVGIPEDPVTGSAHCYLAPYWSAKLGKKVLRSYQASARGGQMECEVVANGRVLLRGQAITVAEGHLKVTS